MSDLIDHPPYYASHQSGVECIELAEWMGFNLGNALKYVWRAGRKSPEALTDLRKARWYVERESERRRIQFDLHSPPPQVREKLQRVVAVERKPVLDAMMAIWTGSILVAIAAIDALIAEHERGAA